MILEGLFSIGHEKAVKIRVERKGGDREWVIPQLCLVLVPTGW